VNIPAIIRRAVVTAMVVAAALGGSTQPASATTPVESQAAHRFCETVNNERAARGLDAVACTYNGAAQAAVETHQDLTAVWMPGTENAATATRQFMQSDDHRGWLLISHPDSMDIGVQCVYAVGDWFLYVGANFSGGHLTPQGSPLPPRNPIVTPYDATRVCAPARPTPTVPPATTPPATVPPVTAPPPAPAPSSNSPAPTGSGSSNAAGGGSGAATSGQGSSSTDPSTAVGGTKPGASSTSKSHPVTTTRSSTSLTGRSHRSMPSVDGSSSKEVASGSQPGLSPQSGTTRGSGGSDLVWWLAGGVAVLVAGASVGFVAWRRARP